MQAFSVPGTEHSLYYHRAHIHSNKIHKIFATEAEEILKLQTQKSCIHRYSFKAVASAIEISCIYLKPSDSMRDFTSYKLFTKNIFDKGAFLKQREKTSTEITSISYLNNVLTIQQKQYMKCFPKPGSFWILVALRLTSFKR